MSHTALQDNWIDVSVSIAPELPTWPGDLGLELRQHYAIEKGDIANVMHLSMPNHIGTHMDAPRHFIKDGITMSAWQAQFTVGRVAVYEIEDPHQISLEALKQLPLKKGDRALFKTKNSSWEWFKAPFVEEYVHFSEAAAAYLAEVGIQTVGVDYLSVGGMKNGIEVHHHILGAGIWIIEGLFLRDITPGTYEMICLPLKLKDADGAPARVLLRPLG